MSKSTAMKKVQRNEKILFVASRVLLLPIVLMVILILCIFIDILFPVTPAKAAVIVTSVIFIIHLIVFITYINFIHKNRRNSINRKGEYLGVGILLIFLGLLYMSSAFAAYEVGNVFASIVMFISSICDFLASIITIILYYLKPQKADQNTLK